MNWSDYDNLLNDKVMEHLGEPIVIHPDDNPITLLALVDIEGVNAEALSGFVTGVIGKADIATPAAASIQKGDVILYAGVRYQVVNPPRKLDANTTQLELGKTHEQRSEIPTIQY